MAVKSCRTAHSIFSKLLQKTNVISESKYWEKIRRGETADNPLEALYLHTEITCKFGLLGFSHLGNQENLKWMYVLLYTFLQILHVSGFIILDYSTRSTWALKQISWCVCNMCSGIVCIPSHATSRLFFNLVVTCLTMTIKLILIAKDRDWHTNKNMSANNMVPLQL